MKITPGLRLILVVALAALTVACVILFLGRVTAVSADLSAITVQVVSDTLVAKSGQTATVTAIVAGSPVSGVVVAFSLSESLGTVTPTIAATDENGRVTATWKAGTVLGAGILTVTDGTSAGTGTAPITLTVGTATTVTLAPANAVITAGQNIAYTTTATDTYGNSWNATSTAVFAITPGAGGSWSGNIYTSRVAGNWTVTAIVDGTPDTAGLNVVPGAPYTITLVANPTSRVVGGAPVNLRATVTDTYGNRVPGAPVTFESSIGIPPLSTDTTDENGLAISSIYSEQAGTAYITATSGTAHGYATVTFLPGVAESLALQAVPALPVVGSSSSLTATVRDHYLNLVGSGIRVTFTKDLGSIVQYGTTTDGIATSSISSTLAGTAHVTATCQGVSGSTVVTFTPGAPYTITLSANPTSLFVGYTSTLTAIISDTYGNRVPGAPVTFTASIGNMPPSATTNSNGVALSSMYSEQRGTAYITATSRGRQGYATVTFNPDLPASLALEASPTSQTVGSSSVLTATVHDHFGNPVAANTPVTFTVNQPGTILSPRMTAANGIATSRVTVTLASLATITATSGAAQGSTPITFTPGAVMTITVSVNPPNLIANSSATATITATAEDRYHNRVPTIPLTGTTVPGTLGTVSGLGATNADGQAFGTWHAGSTVGSGLLSVGNGAVTDTATVSLVFTNPQTVTVQVISSTLFANSGMTTTVTAIVSDTHGNPVSNATVNFGLSPSALGSVISPSVTTDGNGRASNTWTAGNFIGSGQLIVDASSPEHPVSSTAAITLTVDAPYTLTLQAGSTSPVAGIGSVLTATVTDRFLNPVANGTVVTFTSDFGAVLSPVTTTNGVATSWISWTLLGMVHITATSGSAQDSMAVNFVPNVPVTLTLQATPTSLAVGNSSVLTATVVDQFGHYVADGTAVTITPDLGYVLSPVTTTNGIAASVISSTQAGVAHITATSGWAQGFTTVTFRSEVPFTLALQASPASQVVGLSSVLTATVRDRYNNLVASGFLVTFTTDLGSVISSGTTADGVATSFVFARLAGTAHITATCESIPGATVVSFVPDVPYDLTLQADPPLQIVGNSSVLTATVRDQYGNLVADGTVVSLTSSLGSVISPVTTTNGIATSSESSTLSGIANIVATSGVAQGTASATFVSDASATTTSVQLGTDALIVNSNTTTPITATVIDYYGNPVPGVNATGYLSPSTLGQLTWGGPTDPNGQAFGTWTAGTVVGSGMLVVGNSSITVTLAPRRVFLPLVMRGFPPTPVAKSLRINGGAEITYQITVTLQVSATMASDYVERMRFSNDSVHWSDWLTFAPTTTWKLASNNGLATVYAQFMGHKGGISAAISDDILLFKNGDFSQPNLADWTLDPKSDPNSKLSVTASIDPSVPNNPAGRLGDPAYACNAVPIGYGSLSQTFIMPNVPAGKHLYLRFTYHIYTYDRNPYLTGGLDRFDVWLSNTLILRDMYDNRDTGSPNCSTAVLHDLGRNKEFRWLVNGHPGDSMNILFRLWNWPDPILNTYVYLDDVRLSFE